MEDRLNTPSLYRPATAGGISKTSTAKEDNCSIAPATAHATLDESDPGTPERAPAKSKDGSLSDDWQIWWLELYFYLTNEGFGHEFAHRTIKAQIEELDNRSSTSETTIKASHNEFLRMLDINKEIVDCPENVFQPAGDLEI